MDKLLLRRKNLGKVFYFGKLCLSCKRFTFESLVDRVSQSPVDIALLGLNSHLVTERSILRIEVEVAHPQEESFINEKYDYMVGLVSCYDCKNLETFVLVKRVQRH